MIVVFSGKYMAVFRFKSVSKSNAFEKQVHSIPHEYDSYTEFKKKYYRKKAAATISTFITQRPSVPAKLYLFSPVLISTPIS